MIEEKDIVGIGVVMRTHGKQGEIQCRTTCDYWENADAEFVILKIQAIPVPFRVTDWRCKGEHLLLTLKGILTEDQALPLVGCEVYMLRQDISVANDTVLCWQDLVGFSINGCPILAIDDSTANVIATLQDGRLVPLHEDLITHIDYTAQTLTMNLPEGL